MRQPQTEVEKWDRLSHSGGSMWDREEGVVGSGGEGKKTRRRVYSKNHLKVK